MKTHVKRVHEKLKPGLNVIIVGKVFTSNKAFENLSKTLTIITNIVLAKGMINFEMLLQIIKKCKYYTQMSHFYDTHSSVLQE